MATIRPSVSTVRATKTITLPVEITIERDYDMHTMHTRLSARGVCRQGDLVHVAQREITLDDKQFTEEEVDMLARRLTTFVKDQLGAE